MTIKAVASITLSCVVDVWSTTRYYLLQASTLVKPARPTANPPEDGWDDAEPAYTAGSTNTLYFVDLTVFSDGTWAYSQVSVSSAYEAAKAAYNKAQAAQAAAESAVDREQLIYISRPSGTTSVAATTTWVTNAGDVQNAWTLKRPTYDGSYPVVFVATQRRTVAGAVSCTTPIKDDTTTVIDGGHITTGTIDASRVTVDNLNASNLKSGVISDANGNNQWNLNTGALNTQSGAIGDFTLSGGVLSHTDAGDSQRPTVALSGDGLRVSAIDPLLTNITRAVKLSSGWIGFYSNDTLMGQMLYNPQNGGALLLRYNGSNVLSASAGFGNYFNGTADKAYQDMDGNAIASTFLKRSGGVMTGSINRRISVDFDTAPAAAEWNQVMLITDDDSYIRGGVYVVRNTDGSYFTLLGARREYNGSSAWAYLGPKVDPNTGEQGYTVSHPQALRAAAGSAITFASGEGNKQIYAKLTAALTSSSKAGGLFYAPGSVMTLLTGTKISSAAKGFVTRTGSEQFDFFAMVANSYAAHWRATITDITITPGTVYKLTGTAM